MPSSSDANEKSEVYVRPRTMTEALVLNIQTSSPADRKTSQPHLDH